MTKQAGLLATTVVVALATGMSWDSQALAADLVTKAPPAAVETGWWYHGFVEIGGRFFIKDRGGLTSGNFVNPPARENLGKFYEYRDLSPGPFANLGISAGSRDGLYQIDFWARNVGYDDQSYYLDWSKAGEQYLSLGFSQIPHIYNDNATTIYNGAGGNALTVDPALRATLAGQVGAATTAPLDGVAARTAQTNIANAIQGNLKGFELGFQRYNGTASYRWTPDEAWDVRVDYDITRREGTQPIGALTYNGAERGGRLVVELPKPIRDETHNGNLNAEYAGTTPWGKKFTVAAGYGYSAYRNDYDAFTFQNPFVVANGANTPLDNQMSLAPDNSANVVRFNGAIELPWNSRYVGAVNYTAARQDQGFLPQTINPLALPFAVPIVGSSSFGTDNLLVNNILTTKWSNELTQTSRYRYYDYDGSHDPVTIASFLLADSGGGTNTQPGPFTSHGVAYVKQNASTDFVYRPSTVRWLTMGAGAGWERWDRDHRDVNVTDEWMAKTFVNANPWAWSQMRATYVHSERRYDSYQGQVGGNEGAPNYRLFDMANRSRDKGNFYWDFYLPQNIVLTPTGGFRYDDYTAGEQNANPLGLLQDQSWNAGVELAWKVLPDVTLMASYVHERARRELKASRTSGDPVGFATNVTNEVDTFLVGANFIIIPKKFEVKATYTHVFATARIDGGTNDVTVWPQAETRFHHLNVEGKYILDPDFTRRLGWVTETYVKLRYLFERNEVTDASAVNFNYYQLFNGYSNATAAKSIYLGWDNPNYDVHLVALSFGAKW